MARCEDCIHGEVCDHWTRESGLMSFVHADYCEHFMTADGVLLDLKKRVHDKAVYPHTIGIYPYISLKAFDAILQNFLKGKQ